MVSVVCTVLKNVFSSSHFRRQLEHFTIWKQCSVSSFCKKSPYQMSTPCVRGRVCIHSKCPLQNYGRSSVFTPSYLPTWMATMPLLLPLLCKRCSIWSRARLCHMFMIHSQSLSVNLRPLESIKVVASFHLLPFLSILIQPTSSLPWYLYDGSYVAAFQKNKLASLRATLAWNYDQMTHPVTHRGRVELLGRVQIR